ncbi:DUF2516 family protein [Demequina activiva]|uniref:DUF2516 family protein n=1 Tax=Demequina activiva TaxID=1582364 RepID=A0A919UK71_9MICO|nr:DUF2516 family protein [Demequina activiva]GIG55001.1 hypothetical protein Dac01nite_17530 [Demequina activiva]
MFGFLQALVVWLISAGALVGSIWALIDAVKYPDSAFVNAGKKSKALWLVLLGVAAVVAFVSMPPLPFGPNLFGFGGGGALGLLGIAAIAVVLYYFVDVRPKVRENNYGGGGRGNRANGGW